MWHYDVAKVSVLEMEFPFTLERRKNCLHDMDPFAPDAIAIHSDSIPISPNVSPIHVKDILLCQDGVN